MSGVNKEANQWIRLRLKKKREDMPRDLRIDMNGDVYVDGEPYDEGKSKYKNLSIDVEQFNRMSSGEETKKIIEQSRKAKRGETVTIKDEQSQDKRETTTVKF